MPARQPRKYTRANQNRRAVDPDAFPIVCVGASAGGLEAFGQLLEALPEKTGMAFVLIQHLAPEHESLLGGILSKSSRLPILDATQGAKVKEDHIYVIPPNAELTISARTLRLSPRDPTGPHLPVDIFMRSLAADQGALARGVILSGTGTDGTIGLETIKSAGGITFAQSEASAKFPGMPHSVIEGGSADFILAPKEIAETLLRIGARSGSPTQVNSDQPFGERENYDKIVAAIRERSGVDFSAYRDTTIKRRVARRMMLRSIEDYEDYAKVLDSEPTEVDALYNDILINVTSFFRDPEVFNSLKSLVFPELLRHREADTPVRIWVPGCSTGQEVYSLAMSLLEFMTDRRAQAPIQIFATDLDSEALHRAREGMYPQNIEQEVSPERLQRFFTRESGKYRVVKQLRDICTFARQNVAADPPFSRLDLISCRNLLIYLSLPLQRRVIPTFHYSLKPGGFLLLGGAETVGIHAEMFDVVDQQNRIYVKKTSAIRHYPHFAPAPKTGAGVRVETAPVSSALGQTDWVREADKALIRRYSPAGVLINDALDIMQFRGRTSQYLEAAEGEPSHNLLRMASAPLFSAIRDAIQECRTTSMEASRRSVRIRRNAEVSEVTVRVLPVPPKDQPERCYLVLFEPEVVPTHQKDQPDIDEVSRLQQELTAAHEYLQSVIEQKDSASDELRSANEEILSSNEELQSTNEELETAKEELQSVNEELTTVNEQLQNRNAELNHLNDDMLNLLASADVPMLVIGSDLRIRRTTPKAEAIFKLSSDEPYTLRSLKKAFDAFDLEPPLKEVIQKGDVRECEIQTLDSRWWLLRIHPYRRSAEKIDAAVVVLTDINDIRQARQNLQDARDYALAIVGTVREPLAVLDADLRLQTANVAFYDMFEKDRGTAEGVPLYKFANGIFDTPALRRLLENILPAQGSLQDYELPVVIRTEPRTLLMNARRIQYKGSAKEIFLLAIEDITERKRFEKELKTYATQLLDDARHKDEFLALLAHELRNPLAPIANALQILISGAPDASMIAEAYDIMRRHMVQMTRIIDDLLDVSRISNGKIELHKEILDLKKALKGAIETSSSLIESSEHELSVRLPDEPVWIEGDPARLIQIFGNVLNNAAKYTSRKGKISISLAKEQDQAVIRIKDSGIGIPTDMLERIFDVFAQVDTSLGRARGGLGIGLMLVKSLVTLHGGSVLAASEGEGKGSEFTIRLPLTSKSGVENKQLPESHSRNEPIKPLRILVVDDNEASAKTMGWILEGMGHKVQLAFDGSQTLALAQAFKPDAILLDIGLPGLSGYEVCKDIRKKLLFKNTLMIAQTGWGDAASRMKSKAAGFDFHLVKPVGVDELRKIFDAREKGPNKAGTP